MDDKLQKIIQLVQDSELDQTIKEIIIRDLQANGLTDYLKEQIAAYCARTREEIAKIKAQLEEQGTPAT
jgi:HPt (histidine-containing phosphotransfer) domain-containing protein